MTTDGLLRVRDLAVSYRHRHRDATTRALQGVDLEVRSGGTLALVGASGSGKSTLAHAIVGLLPANATTTAGQVHFDGTDLVRASRRTMRSVRGREIAIIPQDPAVSLNPVQRVGAQVAEVLLVHGLANRTTARTAALDALQRAGLSPAQAQQRPHELSGGMQQRVLIATAIAARPRLLIADEPTSALDVTLQRQLLDQLAELTTTMGMALLLITHDLAVATERADRVAVMSHGRVVEVGDAHHILREPRDPVTRALVDAAPSLSSGRPTILVRSGGNPDEAAAPTPLLSATALVKAFGSVRAVDGVSLTLWRARTLGLVGESGSGKSTLARMLLRVTDPTSGRIELDNIDITHHRGSALRELRRRMQLVHQNPYTSLNPRLDVEHLISDPLTSFGIGSRDDRRRRAAELLDRVALPSTVLRRRPVELSGGQRQRVAIARALALSPELVVCDEPVSALDVSVQAQILELLVGLQRDLGVSYLFISHDLAVVREIAHDVAVMRAGRLIELGPTDQLVTHPEHPYTRELLAAVPGGSIRSVPDNEEQT